MSFYERLMQHRKPGESLKAFAERLKVSEALMTHWRFVGLGNSWPIRVDSVVKIAETLQVEPGWLLFGCACHNKKQVKDAN